MHAHSRARSHAPHDHSPAPAGAPHLGARGSSQRRLALTLGLVLAYTAAEALGGWWSGSLALLADAGHMLSDGGALALALLAARAARRPPTPSHTWGFRRAEILAALANGLTLVAIAVYTLVEAARRFGQPLHVDGPVVLGVASGGLLVMLVSLFVLHGGRSESLNVRGVWLHVATDALGSLGVIATGALIWGFGWQWTDLVASLAIAGLIGHSAWGLLREVAHILMEGAPRDVAVEEVQTALEALPAIEEVHDLHVWSIGGDLVSLSCHVVADADASRDRVLEDASRLLRRRFGVHHTALQVEGRNCGRPCAGA
jgi:cobalt-zinc-cadmium efflux system protein